MNSPLLTIVTINRNHAEGLERTVASFLPLRGDPAVEFLFIDGASTDASLAIAKTFYHSDEIHSQPDKGIYDAMNKGLERANGKFVIWINSGDEFIASVWEAVKPRLQSSAAAVIAGGIEVSGGSEVEGTIMHSRQLLSGPEQLPRHNIHHQSAFFCGATALSHGGYQIRYRIVGDRALVLSLYLAGELFEYIPVVVARFEQGGISSMHEKRELENFHLDHELGLINTRVYFQGVTRHLLYHRITIPAWNRLKSKISRWGLSHIPRPAWLKRLFAQPDRSSMMR